MMQLTPEQERHVISRHAHSILRELEAYTRTQIEGVRSLRVGLICAVHHDNNSVLTEQPPEFAIEAWLGTFGLRFVGRGPSFDAALAETIHNISEGKHA